MGAAKMNIFDIALFLEDFYSLSHCPPFLLLFLQHLLGGLQRPKLLPNAGMKCQAAVFSFPRRILFLDGILQPSPIFFALYPDDDKKIKFN